MLPINSYMHPYINHALMKLNGRGQTKTGATIHPSKRGAGSRRSERSMHSVRSRGRRHRKRRLVRELGGSRQGNRHPWWFSPDDRDWLCSPDRSRRCVSLHMLVTAAEFLLGPSHPTGLAPRRLKCADPATYQGQRGSESLRPRLGTVLRGTSRREDGRD